MDTYVIEGEVISVRQAPSHWAAWEITFKYQPVKKGGDTLPSTNLEGSYLMDKKLTPPRCGEKIKITITAGTEE